MNKKIQLTTPELIRFALFELWLAARNFAVLPFKFINFSIRSVCHFIVADKLRMLETQVTRDTAYRRDWTFETEAENLSEKRRKAAQARWSKNMQTNEN